MGKEFDGVGDARCFGGGIIAGVVSVMFRRWAYVVPRRPTVGPCGAISRPIMYDDLASGGSEGRSIEVEIAMDERMG